MNSTKKHIAILSAIAFAIFFFNLGASQLWDRDEPRNAGCALEMMERGNLVVPIFNDELRHQKPVLTYWLIISAYNLFGVNEFAARFWSAILAVGSVLFTYIIARRLSGNHVAFLAAVILSTSLMFDVAARAATPDSILIFCNTAALMIYVLSVFKPTQGRTKLQRDGAWFPQSWPVVIAMYAVMGMGVLAKGPVGFVIPTAVIGLFILVASSRPVDVSPASNEWRSFIMRPLRFAYRVFHPVHFVRTVWLMRPITLAVVVLAVAGPWYWLVHTQTQGDFTQLFFVGEHFGRATVAFEGHSGGLWFYPVAILVGFFPWSVYWLPVAIGLRNDAKSSGIGLGSTFLLCWIAAQVGIFSIAQTKLPSYVTPCYGALAILTACCLAGWVMGSRRVSSFWMSQASGALAFSGLIAIAGLVYLCLEVLHGSWWLVAIGFIPIVVGIAGVIQIRRNRKQPMVVTNMLGAIAFSLLIFGVGSTVVSQQQDNRRLLEVVSTSPDVTVAAYGCMESSWVYYGGRPIFELSLAPETHDSTISLERDHDWTVKLRPTPEDFVRLHADALIISTDELAGDLLKRLPDEYSVIESAGYFLRNKKLCLIGRARQQTASLPEEASTR